MDINEERAGKMKAKSVEIGILLAESDLELDEALLVLARTLVVLLANTGGTKQQALSYFAEVIDRDANLFETHH